MDDDGYVAVSGCIGFAAGAVAFLGAWIWSVANAGFLGFLLGWIPALIVGAVAGLFVAALWPLLLIGGLVAGYFIWRTIQHG